VSDTGWMFGYGCVCVICMCLLGIAYTPQEKGSAEMIINVKGLEDTEDFKAMPAGTYTCVIMKCEETTSKSGNQMIDWEADVREGEFEGHKLFWNTSLVEKALFRLVALLDAAGIGYSNEGFATEDALGQVVDLKVTQEEYEGKVRNKVDDYLPTKD